MFMFAPSTQDLEVVWHGGMRGRFLCALRGLSGFTAQPATLPPDPEPAIPTIGRVIDALRGRGPRTVTDVAIELHDSGGDVADALEELSSCGVVMRVQASLFAIDPHRGELWTLVGE